MSDVRIGAKRVVDRSDFSDVRGQCRRRRFQFTTRTLLVIVTLTSIVFALWSRQPMEIWNTGYWSGRLVRNPVDPDPPYVGWYHSPRFQLWTPYGSQDRTMHYVVLLPNRLKARWNVDRARGDESWQSEVIVYVDTFWNDPTVLALDRHVQARAVFDAKLETVSLGGRALAASPSTVYVIYFDDEWNAKLLAYRRDLKLPNVSAETRAALNQLHDAVGQQSER